MELGKLLNSFSAWRYADRLDSRTFVTNDGEVAILEDTAGWTSIKKACSSPLKKRG